MNKNTGYLILFFLMFASAIAFAGPINVDESYAELMDWTGLQSYPSACPSGYAVTTLEDTVTCTQFVLNAGDNWTGNMDAGDYNLTNLSYVEMDGGEGYARFGLSTTEYTEIGHRGSNSAINAVGDGDLDFRHDGVNAMELSDAGNLNVISNITADNVFILADIYLHTDFTKVVGVAGTFYNISFTCNGDPLKHNFNHTYNDNTNDTITVLYDGIYDVKYAINVNNTAANPDDYAILRITVNDVEHNSSGISTYLSKANAHRTLSGCTRIDLNAGDTIKLQFTSTSTDTSLEVQTDLYLTHYDSARVCLVRIR